ncbi:MAG: CoA transferase [Defluviitaleaceae bacterium]|nr:CoA transferase [Defluviitaleaceae bacterium]
MQRILEGIKILDFTQYKAGPMGTQILGDLGANVIKVERDKGGDLERSFKTFGKLTQEGDSPFFLAMNRNKRSLGLNLKNPAAKEAVYRIARDADVVVQNFRPGVLAKLGFGYEDFKKINPGIIYCSNSGYGLTGPYVSRPGQDMLAQAMSGLIMMNGREDSPTPVATSVADGATSLYLTIAILGALYHKKCTGEGQELDVDLLSCLLAFQQEELTAYLNLRPTPEFKRAGSGLAAPWNGAPYGAYKTSDGRYIVIGVVPMDKMADLIGAPELAGYTDTELAFEHRDKLWEIIQGKILLNTQEHWVEYMLSFDVWCAPVNSYAEVVKDPQVAHNRMLHRMEHPALGEIGVVAAPFRYSSTPAQYLQAPPLIGEHSEQILQEHGYTDDEISRILN